MVDDFTILLALAGVLGSGAIGGVFFAFSSFLMPALGRLPTEQGLATMQSINVAVIRPSFLGAFIGTAVLSLGTVLLAGTHWGESGATLLATGGTLYLVGTFLVTIVRNVPLNNRLEQLKPADAHAAKAWESYVRRWTIWNHVRTAAALLATLSFCLGLVQQVAG